MKVDADDGGGPNEPQGAPASDHGAPGAHGAVGAPTAHKGTHNRPSRSGHARPDSRPGTGADTGFADADDTALPPEAAAAIREATELQRSAQQAAGPGGAAPSTTTPNTTPNTAPDTAPSTTVPKGAAPAAPRALGRGRPANQTTDRNTNQTLNRLAGRPSGPAMYFNAVPAARASRLVLQTSAGTTAERTVTLQCDPPGGTHPKAAEACADVSKADGDLAQMPAAHNPRACFMIYAPVTVTARGSWHGQPVSFTEKFPNSCVMRDKTGSVFDF